MQDANSQQGTILLVEDDNDVRESVAEVLRSGGRRVYEAVDGTDALAVLDQMPHPCLVLTDLRMPRMDGFEFLTRLGQRADAGEFPVLVMSANQEIDRARTLPGVRGALRKPFAVADLLRAVAQHCA